MIVPQTPTGNLYRPDSFTEFNRYGRFASIFFTLPDFSFDNVTDFNTEQIWYNQIALGSTFIVHKIKDVEVQHEEPVENESLSGYSYPITEGKYRFLLRFDYGIGLHKELMKYKNQDLLVGFYDVDNNLIAQENSDGTIQGFEVSKIDVRKKLFGQNNTPQWTEMVIEIEDTKVVNEQFQAVNPTWSFRALNYLSVTLSNAVSPIANIVEATLIDQTTGCEIYVYNTNAVQISDEKSVLTITDVTNKNGKIQITTNGIIYNGTLQVIANMYQSDSLSYDFRTRNLVVTVTDAQPTYIDFEVKELTSDISVNNLSQSELTFIDNTLGVITLTGFTNNADGSYRAEAAAFTNGDLNISSVYYTGATTYQAQTEALTLTIIKALRYTLAADTGTLLVVDVKSGATPVNDVADFSVVDGTVGTQDLFIESVSTGVYTLRTGDNFNETLQSRLISGTLSVNDVNYNGNVAYNTSLADEAVFVGSVTRSAADTYQFELEDIGSSPIETSGNNFVVANGSNSYIQPTSETSAPTGIHTVTDSQFETVFNGRVVILPNATHDYAGSQVFDIPAVFNSSEFNNNEFLV